jgi:tellurite resistance protein
MGGGNKSYRGGPFVGAHQNTRCESGVFFANERHGGLNGKAGPKERRRLDSIFRSEPSVEVFRLIRAFASIESQSSREAVIKFAETKAEKYSESSTSNEH